MITTQPAPIETMGHRAGKTRADAFTARFPPKTAYGPVRRGGARCASLGDCTVVGIVVAIVARVVGSADGTVVGRTTAGCGASPPAPPPPSWRAQPVTAMSNPANLIA
jgi:hypothetical protein